MVSYLGLKVKVAEPHLIASDANTLLKHYFVQGTDFTHSELALVARLSVKKIITRFESCLFTEVLSAWCQLVASQLTRELTTP